MLTTAVPGSQSSQRGVVADMAAELFQVFLNSVLQDCVEKKRLPYEI